MTSTKKCAPKRSDDKLESAKPRKQLAKSTASTSATSDARQSKAKRLSALDAATKVLAEGVGPMTTGEMIEAMSKKGYWTTPGGKTPAATLYSAILREIKSKGKEARFAKADRGKFGLVH
jgi:short subunit dehydrogenase-like uncharacterized protein